MDFWYYLLMPFSFVLNLFYNLFNNYGLALILFALVVKVLLFPVSLKGKRSMIQMNGLNAQLQKLQKQYKNDQQRYQQEMQKLYEKEGVNPMGGCLWSLVPMFVLFPLYSIIREPLKFMMSLTGEQIQKVAEVLNWITEATKNGWIKAGTDTFANGGHNQLYLASLINSGNLQSVQSAVGEAAKNIFAINFNFLGVNLALVPQLKFWESGWMGFGLFMVPVVSALTGILFSIITTKTNNMNNSDDQKSNSTNRTMMLITPLLSLLFGFSMPAALSIYWIANNVLGLAQELISGKMLKKDYEAAREAARLRAIEEKEEEKRLRREKAEQRAREAEEAKKNKGKKKEDPDAEKLTPEQRAASREGMRQYARGRAYDPARFGGVTPYTDPNGPIPVKTEAAPEPEEAAEPAEAPETELTAVTEPLETTEENEALEAAGEDAGAGQD